MKKSRFMSMSEIERGVGGRRKIVYVDDIQCSLVSVKKRLKEFYEVYPAESSTMLFSILEKIKPSLILLDINMPGVDGFKIIKTLKSDPRYSDIPVIFLTGIKDKESVVKGLGLGAADYVIKPFVTEKLVECIEKHCTVIPTDKPVHLALEAGSKPSVLIVDDVLSTLKAIQVSLDDSYKVYTLSNSDFVLDFIQEKRIDLILLDYLMPGLSGFDLIPMIHEIPEYKYVPIIILTSEGTLPHLNEAISLGAADFIVKPFKTKELNDKIAKHLKIGAKK